MSTEIQFEAETVEEAVQKACAELKVEAEELDYTVLDGGSQGLFGLGARPVRIRACRRGEGEVSTEATSDAGSEAPAEAEAEAEAPAEAAPVEASSSAEEAPAEEAPARKQRKIPPGIVGPAPEKAEAAREVAAGIAERMDMTVDVKVRDEDEQIVVVLDEAEGSTDVADMLGTSRPPGLPSFQFLLNKIVNRFPDDRKHIVVEASTVEARIAERRANAAERRQPRKAEATPKAEVKIPEDVDPELAELAQRLVARANEIGKVITIHPMSASDRRAIHQTVMVLQDAETVSDGDGIFRRLHIVPDALRKKKKRRRRRRRRRRGDGEGASGEQAAAAEDAEAIEDGANGDAVIEAPAEDAVIETTATEAPAAEVAAAEPAEPAPEAIEDAAAAAESPDADATA